MSRVIKYPALPFIYKWSRNLHKSKNIMKKEYLTPAVSEVEFAANAVIALSIGYTEEKADGNIGILSDERRSDWGDLWK